MVIFNATGNAPVCLRQIRRLERDKLLQSTKHVRCRGDLYLRTRAIDLSQGLDGARLDSMVTSDPNTQFCILGRPTEETKILLGKSLHIVNGPSSKLFVPAYGKTTVSGGGVVVDAGESLTLNMLEKSPLWEQLQVKLQHIKATSAIQHLQYTFRAGSEKVRLNGMGTTLAKILEDFPGMDYLLAEEICPLVFYGGPPGGYQWFRGTLLTLLVDKLLYTEVKGRLGRIGSFLNVIL